MLRPKSTHLDRQPIVCFRYHVAYYLQRQCRFRNINLMSIAYATRLGLGPTNPEMIIIAQETLLFRWTGFLPVLWLLIPAFSLPNAPPDFTVLASTQIGTLLYRYSKL